MSSVELVAITDPLVEDISAEEFIAYCARVSNPSNQFNHETAPRLLKYCIEHGHWSPFEQVSCTVKITTTRAIAAQILRHRSFVFQEFSQRYSSATTLFYPEFRAQAEKNRQSSTEVANLSLEIRERVTEYYKLAKSLYDDLLQSGVARECARMLLPLSTGTTLFMTGSVRSWIHYINLRTLPDTQKEHRIIANDIKDVLIDKFPNTTSALGWEKSVAIG
jgi:thymidylate synthase (FAD)